MRRLSLLLLLLLVALAAGCGSDPASLQGSDNALRDASTSRVEWKMEGKGVPDWALWRSTGLIDYAKARGEMVIKFKSDAGPEARALYLDRSTYLGTKVGGSMYWVKQSADDPTGADRFMPGPGGTSPDRLLKDLIESSKKVEKLGSEEIRGVTTTHYRAHLDSTKLGTESVAVDAWIDDQRLPRRVRVPFGAGSDAGAVVDLFDFGVPVDIQAPPANEIVPEDEFEKLMDKECGSFGKDFEDANPLCLYFGSSGLSAGSGSLGESIPTTEGK